MFDTAGSDITVTFPRPPFDRMTMTFHWVTVLLVMAALGAAFTPDFVGEWAKPALTWHRSLGVTLWIVTLARLLWRLTLAKLPPFAATMSEGQRLLVKLSECGLYALLLVQPATGLFQTLLHGRAFDLFVWRVPVLMARDSEATAFFHAVHEIGGYCLMSLAGGHAAMALVHRFILKDDVLQTMLPRWLGGAARKRKQAAHRLPAPRRQP
jgi:cytochrome b561